MSVATYAASQFLRLLPRSGLSRAVGRLCDRTVPPAVLRPVVAAYVRAYGVDMSEVAGDPQGFATFDDFFTRPLRGGLRRIEDSPLVSPADGVLASMGPIEASNEILVKGKPYSVADLVGDAEDAEQLRGGSFGVVYLSPRDYHRVHCPVDGRVGLVRGISGDLYPVNSIGERHIPNLFVRNQRVAVVIDSEIYGRVVAVLVGAMIVGRISIEAVPSEGTPLGVHRIAPPIAVRRGDEIGKFHLGSTVVLLVGKGAGIGRVPGPVRYGESLLSPRRNGG